ncbi:MAG TPA: tRNA preQ1(34) S-adenosylmethionine ribosyltransferase-isomerase QueA [Phycisphaerae bacterium]|nr:tRNA preQ1(34) S-adenosylmethionine ribosyltransferase-isomerase QueA [Phycisphaerae bacterium]
MEVRACQFDYALDESLIAQAPAARRDRSRLMVLRRADGAIAHHVFRDLPGLLKGGDLLVVNQTAVIPARFSCRRRTGGRIEGLFLRELRAGAWEVMLSGAGRCKPNERLALQDAEGVAIELAEGLGEGRWRVSVQPPSDAAELLEQVGAAPLPPYIRRPDRTRDRQDRQRYQTVFASTPGAVAAPTAGLHFTDELLRRLDDAGVEIARLTLHVGLGTFLPVKIERVGEHHMHSEWYDLPAAAADRLNAARREGRRIVAVGTTCVRVLETLAAAGREFAAASGWTDLFIYPPAEFRAADAMITNFHLPRSTLLMLAAAFCSPGRTDGIRVILDAYAEAMRLRYRFYSYGDAMLIE